MKHNLIKTAVGTGFILFALAAVPAVAQNDHDWYQNREQYYRGTEWHMHLFDRVRQDLNHVEWKEFAPQDRERINHTKMELSDLQGRLAEHRYDEPALHDVIASLDHVVDDNRLGPHDRDMLRDDLNRLRDYQAHHDSWR